MSSVNKIFFGIFADAGQVAGSLPVLKAIKQKYPEAKLTYAVAKELAIGLIGVQEVDELLQTSSPAELLVRGYTGGYDRVYTPMLYNQEQINWMLESSWIKAAPLNTLSDYIAYRCQDDIIITDRDSIPVPPKPEDEQPRQGD